VPATAVTRRAGRHARQTGRGRGRALPRLITILLAAVGFAGVGIGTALPHLLDGPSPQPRLAPVPSTAIQASASRQARYEGIWIVQRGRGTFLGYRVPVRIAGRTMPVQVVGRTPAVTGSLQVSSTRLERADVLTELATLSSGDHRRDEYLRRHALESRRFSTARFQLASAVPLPEPPRPGGVVAVQAPGALTMHGQTRAVTFSLEGRWTADVLEVVGRGRIRLADFGIGRPKAAGVVSVDEAATIEVQLRLRRA
jgi:polyisoprenoid-binding protein YceI